MATAATYPDLVMDGTAVPARRLAVNGRRAVPWVIGAVDALALAVAASIAGGGAPPAPFVIASLVSLAAARTYRPRLVTSVLDDVPRLLLALLIGTVVAVALDERHGWSLPLVLFLVGSAGTVFARLVTYTGIGALRRRGLLVQRAVIVGAGSVGAELHGIFRDRPGYGVHSMGLVDDVAVERGLPLVGTIDQLDGILDDADMVVVAFGPRGEQELVPVLRAVKNRLDVEILVVPRFFELGIASSGPQVEEIWGIPLYRVRRGAFGAWSQMAKRTMDVVGAGALLLVLAPVMAALALGVRMSSPGPVLFRQSRIGKGGQPIEVLKLRTMRVNDDSDVQWSVDADARVTPLGRWLRALSLDELPQLWNVLRGEMSLVGPRPERPYFVEAFSGQVNGYGDRHRVPAGLTGLAQVNGLRGDTSIAERARFDNAYVENWTPWLDVKVLLRTLVAAKQDASPPRSPRAVDGQVPSTRPIVHGRAPLPSRNSSHVVEPGAQAGVPTAEPAAQHPPR